MQATSIPPPWSGPAGSVPAPDTNVVDVVLALAASRPAHAAFARKGDGRWHTVTSKEFSDRVTALAAGLMAAGVHAGDRVALMSGTSFEWTLCDFAIMAAGGVTVPIYATSSAAQVTSILTDSRPVAAFVESREFGHLIEGAGVPSIRDVWAMDGEDLDTVAAAGRSVSAEQVRERRRGVTGESLATIVYRSGTTGRPKGCMISHNNLITEVRSVALADGISRYVLTDRSSILLFLPLAHILARVVQLAAVHNGTQIAHTGDIGNLAAELHRFKPTLVMAVPRVFEKLYNTAANQAAASGHARLFRAAEQTAVAYSMSLDSNGPGASLRLRRRLFDRLVYARIREAMGGQVTCAVSGGAPLGARLGHFLRGCGVSILEGWGLTETSAGVTLNLPTAQRIGTVGQPLPGCSVRIAEDGEVLVKGGNVFGGYWDDALASADAFDDDGWFRTGDLGRLDDGYLTIAGRKKDLIITASGKNVAPAPIEDRLRAHWLIDQCVIVGDRRPYVGALVTLDEQALVEWQRGQGLPATPPAADLRHDPTLKSMVQAAVDGANRAVSRAEGIKAFRIIGGQFTVGEELTPTQKVRREYVLAKFAAEIEAMYAGPAGT